MARSATATAARPARLAGDRRSVGTAWAIWYLLLFFLPGTTQSAMGLLTASDGLFVVSCLTQSVIYLWVSEHLAGGVAGAVLLHAASNASLALPPPATLAAGVMRACLTRVVAAIAYLVTPGRDRQPTRRTARGEHGALASRR